MKFNDVKKLLTKSVVDLQRMVVKIQQELVDLRMQKALNKNKNVRLYKAKRQDLARVKTVLTEKMIVEQSSGSN